MEGIKRLLVDSQKGQFQHEGINDSGGWSILECEEYLLTDLKVRLFRLQVFIQELQERSGTYTLTWDGYALIFKTEIVSPLGIIIKKHSQSYETSTMPRIPQIHFCASLTTATTNCRHMKRISSTGTPAGEIWGSRTVNGLAGMVSPVTEVSSLGLPT